MFSNKRLRMRSFYFLITTVIRNVNQVESPPLKKHTNPTNDHWYVYISVITTKYRYASEFFVTTSWFWSHKNEIKYTHALRRARVYYNSVLM